MPWYSNPSLLLDQPHTQLKNRIKHDGAAMIPIDLGVLSEIMCFKRLCRHGLKPLADCTDRRRQGKGLTSFWGFGLIGLESFSTRSLKSRALHVAKGGAGGSMLRWHRRGASCFFRGSERSKSAVCSLYSE